MNKVETDSAITFDMYIRTYQDQEIKGILLKLKNEIRKPEVGWDVVRALLVEVKEKNEQTFMEIFPLILD